MVFARARLANHSSATSNQRIDRDKTASHTRNNMVEPWFRRVGDNAMI